MLGPTELHIRAALLRAFRTFFTDRSFLEVDTPIRQPVLLPEAHIQPLRSGDFFLQSSPESCMKRLLAAGSGDIFQICQCFRKEERGRNHLEEFTMLEWYRVGASYRELMQDCLELTAFVVAELNSRFPHLMETSQSICCYKDEGAGFPKEQLTVAEAFARWSDLTVEEAMARDLFDEILVEQVEPRLGRGKLSFLSDYPAEMASLARRKTDNPEVAERFELYIEGVEIANGFSELTDASEQRLRFTRECELIAAKMTQKPAMPEKFLTELENLPACAGIALGVDRLFMLILGKDEISEVVSFAPDDL